MSTLNTQRLRLRSFFPGDWKDLYEYLSDPQVVRYEPYPPFTLSQCYKEAKQRAKNPAFWAVCLTEGGKMIGNLYFEKQGYDTWSLGYVFNPRFQRQGYATEAAMGLLNHAFSTGQVRRVVAMCNPDNEPSWRLMERLGMRREGYQRENIYFHTDPAGNPIWQDTYQYAILDKEWRRGGLMYSPIATVN